LAFRCGSIQIAGLHLVNDVDHGGLASQWDVSTLDVVRVIQVLDEGIALVVRNKQGQFWGMSPGAQQQYIVLDTELIRTGCASGFIKQNSRLWRISPYSTVSSINWSSDSRFKKYLQWPFAHELVVRR